LLSETIYQAHSERKDKITEFNIVLYYCNKNIRYDTENLLIAEQINKYDLEVYGPNSELTFYSYYLLIYANCDSGDFENAYKTFTTAYNNFKTFNKLNSPLLANCIDAVCGAFTYLSNKEKDEVQLLEIAYEIRKKAEGDEAPITIRTLTSLAFSYCNYAKVCNNFDLQQEFYQKAKKIFLEVYHKQTEPLQIFLINEEFKENGWDKLM
jgi:hypothetical protein